jgi:hypothetical protein
MFIWTIQDAVGTLVIVFVGMLFLGIFFVERFATWRKSRRKAPPMTGTVRERLYVMLYLIRESWRGNIGWLHDRAVVDDSDLRESDGRLRILSPITMAEDKIRLTLMQRAGDSIEIRRDEESHRTVIQGRLLAKLR